MASQFWTPEEDTRLRALVADGHTITEIASLMPGREYHGVRWRGRRLGLCFAHKPALSSWPGYASDLLRHYWNVEGLSARECGRRLGISRNSVIGRAHRMGLDARKSPIKYREKPVEQPADGCLWLAGERPYTPCQAGREPGRPYCAKHCDAAYEKPKPSKKKGPLITAADRIFGMVF
jgi:GcrA cell cycle regulator